MKEYQILLHQRAYKKVESYLVALKNNQILAGKYLARELEDQTLTRLETRQLIACLLDTKRPCIFAESAVYGDGRDWNQQELAILGDIGIAVPVTVFDDGKHRNPEIHAHPFPATLLYVAGALLRNDRGLQPADWTGVTQNNKLNEQGYFQLIERRLLPSLMYANEVVTAKNKTAFVTVPGIGCGQFAGPFDGRMHSLLESALIKLLSRHVDRLPNIRAVYYDPYSSGNNQRLELGHLSFFVRPLQRGNNDKPQLCPPQQYEEENDDFSDCELFSFVAWDHVSWPGNDFWSGSRVTDDGVKAAATDSMFAITGLRGSYNPQTRTYSPPPGYHNWQEVVSKNELSLNAQTNLLIFPRE